MRTYGAVRYVSSSSHEWAESRPPKSGRERTCRTSSSPFSCASAFSLGPASRRREVALAALG